MWNTTAETLDDLSENDVAKIPIEVLARIDAELEEADKQNRRRRIVLKRAFAVKYNVRTLGTITTHDGNYVVKITTPKRVDWDQKALATLWNSIGATASEYISVTYGVSEAAYKAWPECIRKEFECARTVKPGAPTIAITKKEDAA